MFSVGNLVFKKTLAAKGAAFAVQAGVKPMMFSPMKRAYHENVIDHYEKPRNVGSLNSKEENVGTGLVGAPAWGDVMRLQIQVNKENNKIEKAVFKVD